MILMNINGLNKLIRLAGEIHPTAEACGHSFAEAGKRSVKVQIVMFELP